MKMIRMMIIKMIRMIVMMIKKWVVVLLFIDFGAQGFIMIIIWL